MLVQMVTKWQHLHPTAHQGSIRTQCGSPGRRRELGQILEESSNAGALRQSLQVSKVVAALLSTVPSLASLVSVEGNISLDMDGARSFKVREHRSFNGSKQKTRNSTRRSDNDRSECGECCMTLIYYCDFTAIRQD